MKPIDVTTLQILLDDDLVWRRKEISDLITMAQSGRVGEQRSARRASIPMLYAHWEGYTKNSFTRYFELVSFKRKRFDELSENFTYLSSKSELSSISSSSPEIAIAKLAHVFAKGSVVNTDPMRKHVQTKSNLRWNVLRDLYTIAGISMPTMDLETEINVALCDARNAIAHGESAAPELDAIKQIRDQVFGMLDAIKNSLVTASANETYLKSSPA